MCVCVCVWGHSNRITLVVTVSKLNLELRTIHEAGGLEINRSYRTKPTALATRGIFFFFFMGSDAAGIQSRRQRGAGIWQRRFVIGTMIVGDYRRRTDLNCCMLKIEDHQRNFEETDGAPH